MSKIDWTKRLPLETIKQISLEHSLDYRLVAAICMKESSGNSFATRFEPNYKWVYKVNDQLRILNAFQEVRYELQDKVRQQYPEGIEQSESDNWTAVYKYRMLKEKTPGLARQQTDNIPLDPTTKAKLGYEYGRIDSIAPLAISDEKKLLQIEQEKNESLQKLEENKPKLIK